jgi:hypothetical protein
VLGGLGQCGIIVRATLRMVPAPTMALLVRPRYKDLYANSGCPHRDPVTRRL